MPGNYAHKLNQAFFVKLPAEYDVQLRLKPPTSEEFDFTKEKHEVLERLRSHHYFILELEHDPSSSIIMKEPH